MTTPNAMPKKSLIAVHQHILGSLLALRPASWVHKTLVPATSTSKETVVKTTISHQELRFPFAQNVSEQNIDIAAKRWSR
ncbi:hypothetical protein ASE48_08600 [Mycobacterium sp. Root265]|uniref:hypothetical protein n=1 Tax=Mycobacterium sp. Root265 TaxID=1736504 RepID=UPI00070B2934|nr:hypothetical protein [Mycobacterium sp. Root265]KRD08612.1 hypothetical protein ASE48_08600 [Mycobacterium sp. Root265]